MILLFSLFFVVAVVVAGAAIFLDYVFFNEVWESLVLEQGVKNHLLEYASTALLFTGKGVSKNVISWNRFVGAVASTLASLLYRISARSTARDSGVFSATCPLLLQAKTWTIQTGVQYDASMQSRDTVFDIR